jgi:endogenous inhibitor of DNA gyrase (YacG/DUF329 family)
MATSGNAPADVTGPDREATRSGAGGGPPALGPRCPHCRRPAVWDRNPHRPFCSLACRLLDLGVWLNEGYRIGSGDDVPQA